jgi:phage regulator Rha-like protein
MTLKEITDLLDVRHNNAMITVASMTLEEGFGHATEIQYRTFKGNSYKTYLLNKRQSIAVASRLNTTLLMKVIDRWQELEAKLVPQTLPQALRAYADEVEAHEKTTLILTHTKVELEDSKVRLDESREWFSIKRMATLTGTDWTNYSWRKLKPLHDVQKIFDANYGKVNVYHRDAWLSAYPDTVSQFSSIIPVPDMNYSMEITDWIGAGWTVDLLINQGYLRIH